MSGGVSVNDCLAECVVQIANAATNGAFVGQTPASQWGRRLSIRAAKTILG